MTSNIEPRLRRYYSIKYCAVSWCFGGLTPVKDSHTRIKLLALASGHGRYITVTPERGGMRGPFGQGPTGPKSQKDPKAKRTQKDRFGIGAN
jgi:hypothetical protein